MNSRSPCLALLLAALSFVFLRPAGAQENTPTVTTTLPGQTSPANAQTTVTTVQPAPREQTIVVERAPGQHLLEIELAVARGSVQAYFGRAKKGEKFEVGDAAISIRLPSTMTVNKIVSRDDDSENYHKITVEHPWHVSVPFNGGGRYVFNISDWSDDPVVAVATVRVDGVVMFSGQGRKDDFDKWPERVYGPGVHKTGDREIAFNIPGE